MADQLKPLRAVCVVCGQEKDCLHSLRLTKPNGKWQSNPVCRDDRTALIRQAKSEGQFIPFYSLETSEQEALKRNEEAKRLGSFVSQYGKTCENSKKPFNGFRVKSQVRAGNLMIVG